jgi:hypothetical protein
MTIPTFGILGDFTFRHMTGQEPQPRRSYRLRIRPGVPGTGTVAGSWFQEPFSIETLAYAADADAAEALMAAYRAAAFDVVLYPNAKGRRYPNTVILPLISARSLARLPGADGAEDTATMLVQARWLLLLPMPLAVNGYPIQ